MSKKVTAKVTVTGKVEASDDQHTVYFSPDYDDGRNKEWAKFTPALSMTMTVKEPVSDFFEDGKGYLLTFEVADTDDVPMPTDNADAGKRVG